ncbi:UPF0696 protein C11orf68-like isoform X2 [Antedon mediterranea]|uniref:UPF0696 protein C11orf68-like isoform X2 n=1 Tax=Antedon mediterranea TaxID=105859 RepID=UPI003AF5B2D2
MATAGRTHQTFGSDERIFDPECNEETIDDFLFINKPSQLCISDGITWIRVLGPGYQDAQTNYDVDHLAASLQKLTTAQQSQATLNQEETSEDDEIAITQDEINSLDEELTSGKWMIFPKRDYVDHIWGKIAEATVSGKLGEGATMAKVAPVGDNEESSYIAVYTPDYRNKAQVYEVERKLRDIGIKGTMKYKPDINTKTGVYRHNNYKMRPSIYVTYDKSDSKGKSGVKSKTTSL